MRAYTLEELRGALGLLGTVLKERATSARIFVVGGVALALQQIVDRPTVDVDVLARVSADGDLIYSEPLEPEIKAAALRVAQVLGLDPEWLNDTVATPPPLTLPEGALERAVMLSFGDGALHVHLVGRADAVCMKLLAAVDRYGFGGRDDRHLEDLQALAPSDAELARADAWCYEHEAPSSASHSIRARLLQEQFGFAVARGDG